MITINQATKSRVIKKAKIKRKALQACPQKKGVCIRIFEMTPRKPNSARRKVVRVRLSTRRFITAHIPGEGHPLQEHSVVLIHGGRSKDLPGVKYRVIRGKFDSGAVKGRSTTLSYYGKSK
uniref:Ribosomal protein S12 n=1 Tax=Eukaryota sp. BB2 TaxID=1949062 RepID=A0A1W5QHB9_9EUKA|nr:ribosomal protein S12 [Eukaryota sp. BB2]AQL10449.1 ribosomal protein S12 [Eukaryota sp. BB2]